MEKPYHGRTTIQDRFVELEITIPARKNWFGLLDDNRRLFRNKKVSDGKQDAN
jgi:hypothetical protein